MTEPERNAPRHAHGMGGRLAGLAIRNPVTVCMIFLSIITMGALSVPRIPLMLMPTLDAPVMFVTAEYFRATPTHVLESITKPLEEALATVPGVQRLSSRSSANGAVIQVWCGMGADTSMLRSKMREKVELIMDDLPEDLRQVAIHNFNTDDIPILEGTLTANRDLRKDYDFLDARVKKPLERIPGVGNVDLWGSERKQVDIYLRLADIKRYNVDIGALYRSIDGSNLNLSLGRVSDGGQRYSAVAKGSIRSVEELAQFPVGKHGLVLSDVADVVFDQRPRNSGRHQNGAYAVGLSIQKTSEANIVDVVDAVGEAFAGWEGDPTMDGLAVRWWHDSGEAVRDGIGELLQAGFVGATLAVIVLFAFLRRLDASLAVGGAIPLSVLAAVGFLHSAGYTLNILTMMGLMLASGMLVDNAVVVLEAILQRHEQGEAAKPAARRGAGEVTLAVIAATSTTMIIFVPLLFDSESQLSIMLSHVGIAIIFALLCSLFISLTLIPLISPKILTTDREGRERFDERAARRLSAGFAALASRLRRRRGTGPTAGFRAAYLRAVNWNLDRRYRVGLLLVPAILGAATWALMNVVPDNSPTATTLSSVRIGYDFSENYHYAKIERDYVNPVEDFLHANAEDLMIQSTMSSYGNGYAWTRLYVDVDLAGPDDVERIRKTVREGLPVIPGAKIELGQEEGGDRNWISANIYGDDPAVLKELAASAREKLLATDGFGEVFSDLSGSRDEVRVHIRREVASKHDISPLTVSQILSLTVRSQRLRSYRTPEGEIELWVGIDPSDMQGIEDLKSLVVGAGAEGEPVLLGHVADLRLEREPSRITRENRQTFTEIQAIYEGGRKEEGRKAFSKVLDNLPYEAGYGWSYGFWTNRENEDVAQFAFSMMLAVLMVYFVMAALFESVLHPFAILFALPFSVVGIVLFLTLTGTPFNIMAWVGIIILIGIVVNNGIVLINHINNLRREGLARRAAIQRGCSERLRPICMTAMTTIVGLIPLAWGDGNLMGMSYFPLARTVMGGLMASTVLTLVVLPVYYVILDDFGLWFRRMWIASGPRRTPEPVAGD